MCYLEIRFSSSSDGRHSGSDLKFNDHDVDNIFSRGHTYQPSVSPTFSLSAFSMLTNVFSTRCVVSLQDRTLPDDDAAEGDMRHVSLYVSAGGKGEVVKKRGCKCTASHLCKLGGTAYPPTVAIGRRCVQRQRQLYTSRSWSTKGRTYTRLLEHDPTHACGAAERYLSSRSRIELMSFMRLRPQR